MSDERINCDEALKRVQADIQVKYTVLQYFIAIAGIVYKHIVDLLVKSGVDRAYAEQIAYLPLQSQLESILQEIYDDVDTIARILAYRVYGADMCIESDNGLYVAYYLPAVLEKLKDKITIPQSTPRRYQGNAEARG